ncbi:TipAS antibiotic-recognition domain-containing protein [Candidatus Palauibacter sp.]|uniref:TipAS antibiotic-recognition domain-containing protein n=1 Tax=Candidatus Palauibacter sp. TaxID=3101350 RepID=UPI003CC63BC5
MSATDNLHAQYAEEARERWGHADAWRESVQRTRGYSEDDWTRIRAESDEVFGRMAALMAEGTSPTSAAAMDLAEAHRRHIDRWFYACSPDMHRGLAAMYTADPRFTDYFEERHEGLAAFVADAIRANAARARRKAGYPDQG